MKKNLNPTVVSFMLLLVLFTQCTIVRPGKVAIKSRFGKVNSDILLPGFHGFNPFTNSITTFDTQVEEYSKQLALLPTKEGLEITAELTFLQHIIPDSVPSMFKRFGLKYKESLIANTYIATSREITAHYFAKDLITQREELEKAITRKNDAKPKQIWNCD
jgi:regulator of protease activity HflC (stomatin/prohibitin superfamily)